MTEDLLKNLNKDIIIHIDYFIKIINKTNIDRISKLFINEIKIKYLDKYFYLNKISNIVTENFNTVIITPYDKLLINIIYKSIIENNIMDYNILKLNNKSIKIEISQITEEKRKKIILFLNKELEKTKINLRNIRRNFNNKIKLMLEKKEINKDEKNKLLNNIDLYINKNIKYLDNIFNLKKNNLLKI